MAGNGAAAAHALLTRLNAEPALAEPGVVATLTAADVPGEGNSGSNRHDEPLFPVEIVHHSQAVAWVLGESLEAARRGAARASKRNIRSAAGGSHDGRRDRGRELSRGSVSVPQQVMRPQSRQASPGRIEGELFIGGQEHFYLETQASLARLDEEGVFVESSTQHPSWRFRRRLWRACWGIAMRNRVTVECRRMGGAFGGRRKCRRIRGHAIAALGVWKTKRPVCVRAAAAKLDMALTGKRHPFLARFAAGFEPDGRLCAVRLQLYSDGVMEPRSLPARCCGRALFHCDNAYLIPHLTRRFRLDCEDKQNVAELQIPRLRWSAGDDRHRRHPRIALRVRSALPPAHRARAEFLSRRRCHDITANR